MNSHVIITTYNDEGAEILKPEFYMRVSHLSDVLNDMLKRNTAIDRINIEIKVRPTDFRG